jgi:hypothetical protein
VNLSLTGGAGLVLLLVAVTLAVVLDLPGGATGWRAAGPGRRVLLAVTAVVVIVAMTATWVRLHP